MADNGNVVCLLVAPKNRKKGRKPSMKIKKTEWIWLIVTAVLYIAYNIPGVPAYHQPVPTLIHAAITVLPLWVLTYIFMPKVYRIYKIREENKKEDK